MRTRKMKLKSAPRIRYDFNVEDLGNASAFYSEVDSVKREICGSVYREGKEREDGLGDDEAPDVFELMHRHAG